MRSLATVSRRVWPQKVQGLFQILVSHQNTSGIDWWIHSINILNFSHFLPLRSQNTTAWLQCAIAPWAYNTIQNLASYILILSPIIPPKLSWDSCFQAPHFSWKYNKQDISSLRFQHLAQDCRKVDAKLSFTSVIHN